MAINTILWDLDDDSEGNVSHCAEHGVTKEEVEEVMENPTDEDVSRTTGYPVVFGSTKRGRHLLIVFERIDDTTVYPITAYQVPRRPER